MRHWLPCSGLSLALVAAAGPPAIAQYVQLATTENYVAAEEAVREAYIAGIMDTLMAYEMAPEWLPECVTSHRLRELRSGFDIWLETHPLEHRFSLPTTFITAMESYCSRPVPW